MKGAYLVVSPNCNLSCRYCFQLGNPTEKNGHQDYHHQPLLHADRRVLDAFVDYCVREGVDHIEFFGGEPLVYWPSIERVVTSLSERVRSSCFGVVTNGTLLTSPILDFIEEHRIALLLSLDGDRPRHDAMRGGFDRYSRWFPRLAKSALVTVAMLAAILAGLSDNLRFIWRQGLKWVYINIIETYDWYASADVPIFEREYEAGIAAMLRGEGELICALGLHQKLRRTTYDKGCGITRKGLACDWHGLLYPCHRAVELGPSASIGTVFAGLDPSRDRGFRDGVYRESCLSRNSLAHPLVSFCPVAVRQKHGSFGGLWNEEFCAMIEVKAKLVSKYHWELEAFLQDRAPRASALGAPVP